MLDILDAPCYIQYDAVRHNTRRDKLELFFMKHIRNTTLFIVGMTFIVFEEVVKSIEEASRAVDQKKKYVNQRLINSSLKRQAVNKP